MRAGTRVGAPVPPATLPIPAQQARFVRLNVTKLGLPFKEGWPDPVSRLQLAEVQVVDSAHPRRRPRAARCGHGIRGLLGARRRGSPSYITDGKTRGDTPPIGFTSLEHHGQDVLGDPDMGHDRPGLGADVRHAHAVSPNRHLDSRTARPELPRGLHRSDRGRRSGTIRRRRDDHRPGTAGRDHLCRSRCPCSSSSSICRSRLPGRGCTSPGSACTPRRSTAAR